MNVHLNLRNKRKGIGLTQEEVANRLGISRQAISKWENGYSYPDLDNLMLLSKLYGISVDDLLQGDNVDVKKVKRRKHRLLLLSFLAVIIPIVGGIIAVVILKNVRYKYVEHKNAIVFLCTLSIILSVVLMLIGVNLILYWHN